MRRTFLIPLTAAVGFVLASPPVDGAKFKSSGEVRLESRFFSNDQNDFTKDFGVGLFSRVEASLKHKPFREKVRLYGRLDQQDSGRTILVVEELWLEWKFSELKVRVGANLLNWSATEAFHPADIMNARNLDSDVESYEKVGEPMVSVAVDVGEGVLSAYFMPYYSQPILPSTRSRLNFIPPGVELGPLLRMRQDGSITDSDFGLQGAVRLTQTIGSADVGLHVIHHLDRYQPEVVFNPATGALSPLFRTVTQLGGTYQHVLGGFIVKLEAGYRIFARPEAGVILPGLVEDRDHLQVAGGLEYGVLHDSGVESTLILEAQSVFLTDKDTRRALQIFQRDALIGWRVALNNASSTTFLASAIVDLEDPENVLFNATYSQRLYESWTVSLALRTVFVASDSAAAGGITLPAGSDHVRIFLSRFF